MAGENEVVEQTPAEERKAAQAAFKTASDEAPVKAAEPVVVEKEESAPAPEQVKAADPWEGVPAVVRTTLDGITGKLGAIDRLANEVKAGTGRVAAIQSELAAAKAAAKTAETAPTPAQIEEASKSLDKWDALKGDFEEWSAGIDQRIAERIAAERAEMLKATPQPVDVESIKRDVGASMTESIKQSEARAERRARAFARVDAKYPDWEFDVHTPDGGLTPAFAAWASVQAPEVKALADSEDPRDAIKMIDAFYKHRESEALRGKNQQRLESAIPARGTQGQREPTLSDDEAARKAFASA